MAKYYPTEDDAALKTPKDQETFEASLFQKTARQHSEVVTFDGYTAVYKTRSDITYYVVGSEDENELILLTVLSSLRDTLDILLSGDSPDGAQIDQQRLLENLDYLLLVIDEIVDGGIIFETDPQVLAERVALKDPEDDDLPITEQTVSQVIDQASEFARSFMGGFY